MPHVSTTKAPSEVLERLREIDPRAVLVHLGGTTWWLGIAEPNNPARERLHRMLARDDRATLAVELGDPVERALVLEQLGKEHLMHQIMAYGVDGSGGFRPVELRECATLGDFYELVNDFRQADWNWKTFGVKRFFDRLRAARDKSRQLIDRIQADARSWWHHFVRRSVSILNPWGSRPAEED